MKSSNKLFSSSFKLFTVEVFSVVLGVVLALMLNQWNEDRNNAKKVEVAMTNITNELDANSKMLKIIHERNKVVFNDSTATKEEDENKEFTPAIQMQNTAWNTFLSAGLSSNIDYDLLLTLSQVYSIQEVYKSFGISVVESYLNITALSILLSNKENEDQLDDQIKENLRIVYNAEEPLLDLFDQALDKISEHYPGAVIVN